MFLQLTSKVYLSHHLNHMYADFQHCTVQHAKTILRVWFFSGMNTLLVKIKCFGNGNYGSLLTVFLYYQKVDQWTWALHLLLAKQPCMLVTLKYAFMRSDSMYSVQLLCLEIKVFSFCVERLKLLTVFLYCQKVERWIRALRLLLNNPAHFWLRSILSCSLTVCTM